jgi:hypothetical protein
MIFSAAENDIDLVAPRWMWKLKNDRNNVKKQHAHYKNVLYSGQKSESMNRSREIRKQLFIWWRKEKGIRSDLEDREISSSSLVLKVILWDRGRSAKLLRYL